MDWRGLFKVREKPLRLACRAQAWLIVPAFTIIWEITSS